MAVHGEQRPGAANIASNTTFQQDRKSFDFLMNSWQDMMIATGSSPIACVVSGLFQPSSIFDKAS
jgi:hypothetical protein